MKYRVIIPRPVEKRILHLATAYQNSIMNMLFQLEINPRPSGCRKLTGRDGWRIRVGDYRIIYDIDDQACSVIIRDVAHRREIYR